jgi:hypothetical protein
MPIQSTNPFELHTVGTWKGLNQQSPRGSIDDDEEFWNENLFAIGPGALRSCWGHGPAVYTAPAGTSILRMFFGFIGDTTGEFSAPPPGRYGWFFLSDGTVDQVDLDTGTVVHVGAVWTSVGPQYWASAVVWRPSYYGNTAGQQGGVLFGSPKGLYAWDGATLSAPGANAPDWLTNGLEQTPGVPFVMPAGLPGIYCMEVYQARLFVAGKDVISFSAPSNGADFSTTDGGGSFGYFGNKLTYIFNDLAASSGYLFVYGDSSIDMISNVQLASTSTTPVQYTTNLNYQNIDPQVGHRFPRPVGRIGRYMQMFNGAGIFQCKGAEADQIGARVTKIFDTLDTSQFYPTMCPATMFGFKVLLCNGMFTDPWGVKRSLLLMWHPISGQEFWSIASQNLPLTYIAAYEQDSIITPYGTDGQSVYQLFAQPDATLIKKLSTKFLRGQGIKQVTIKNWKRLFLEFHDESGQGVAFTGQMITHAGGIAGGSQDIGFQMPPGQRYAFEPQAIEGAGIAGAVDLQSYSPDFTIERLHLGAEDRTLFGA